MTIISESRKLPEGVMGTCSRRNPRKEVGHVPGGTPGRRKFPEAVLAAGEGEWVFLEEPSESRKLPERLMDNGPTLQGGVKMAQDVSDLASFRPCRTPRRDRTWKIKSKRRPCRFQLMPFHVLLRYICVCVNRAYIGSPSAVDPEKSNICPPPPPLFKVDPMLYVVLCAGCR